MAYTLKDRVLVTSTSTGTGDFALGAAQTGYQAFSVVGDGASIPYTIQGKNPDGTLTGEWEVGVGTYHSSGNYITRDTVFESSNANAKVLFTAGDKDVFLDLPSELVVQGPNSATASDFVAFDGTSGKVIKDSGFSSASFATAAQGAKADTAVQPGSLATVATTGSYTDLINKPTIPAAQVNSDWTATSGVAEILNKPTLGTAAALNAGVANGVATLDSGGKVPTSQIPQMGDLNYQGTWNASTNTPTLASGVGTKGYYYVVNVAGTTNLDGITDWAVGDWAVFNGTVWEQIDNTDAVTSVNGYTGAVNLTYTDVGAANAGANTNITSMSGVTGGISTVDYVTFDTAYATALTAGQIGWDGFNTLGLGMSGGNVVQRIGEDVFIYVKASSAITKGQLCMFTGAVGASSVVTAAPSTGVTNGQYIIGLAAESIALNDFGLIQTVGSLKGFDTSAFADGDILYYDSAVTGGMTNVYPTSGPIVTVAAVTNSGNGGSGSVQIRVSVTQRITAGTGISVSQTISGTTVTNTGGTVTNVTGTAPVSVATGTTTPVISMAKATASVNGYLSSTDFTTFVSKQNAYTNLSTIGALANNTGWLYNNGTGSFSYSTPTAANVGAVPTSRTVSTVAPLTGGGALSSNLNLSMPQANATDDGYLSATDWASFNSKVSSPWTQSGPDVYYTGGPVGIGTTNPLALLQIQNTSGDSSLSVLNTGTGVTDNAYCKLSAGLYEIQSIVYANGSASIITPCILTLGTNALTPISIQTNGVTRMYFDSVGRVGIGTTSQTEQLEVIGNTKATSFIKSGGTSSEFLKADGSVDSSTYLTSAVTTIAGTANQITASASTGAVTLSTPSTFIAPGSIAATTTVTGTVLIASQPFIVNSQTVTANYSIPSGSSATSAGPITVNSGVTVTIPSGSKWVVL